MKLVILLLSLFAFANPLPVFAKDYGDMGTKAVAAWACAFFTARASEASFNDQAAEFERLFQLGMANMTEFVEAKSRGEITNDDYALTPFVILENLYDDAPPAFSAGNIWAHIGFQIRRDFDNANNVKIPLIPKTYYSNRYRDGNCRYLR